MVQTRRQYARWVEEQRNQDNELANLVPSQLSSLGFLSQESLPNLSLSEMPGESFPTLGQAMYRPNDRVKKKHRLHDSYPYNQTVRSYKRRTAP